MKFSSETLQAKAAEGKYPYLLFAPNREEPSVLKEAVNGSSKKVLMDKN